MINYIVENVHDIENYLNENGETYVIYGDEHKYIDVCNRIVDYSVDNGYDIENCLHKNGEAYLSGSQIRPDFVWVTDKEIITSSQPLKWTEVLL